MGARQLAVYGMPLGLMAAGAMIERVGYAMTVSAWCVFGLVFTVAIGLRWGGRARRALRPSASRTA